MSSNVRTVNERDDFNVIKYIMSINSNLAKLNSKVDGFNDAVKVANEKASEANSKASTAFDLAQKDEYEIDNLRSENKDQQKEIKGLHKEITNITKAQDDKTNNHVSWWISGIAMIISLVSGFIGNFIK